MSLARHLLYSTKLSGFIRLTYVNRLAGSDTTAIILRGVFYYLIKDPVRFQKLQTEIDDANSKGSLSERITFTECQQLPYLWVHFHHILCCNETYMLTFCSQAVIKEALRLSPPLCCPLERLVPEGGDVICGKRLGRKTVVGISPWVVQRDPTVFGEDFSAFRPERWMEGSEERLKIMEKTMMAVSTNRKLSLFSIKMDSSNKFAQFGAGARTCMGKSFQHSQKDSKLTVRRQKRCSLRNDQVYSRGPSKVHLRMGLG